MEGLIARRGGTRLAGYVLQACGALTLCGGGFWWLAGIGHKAAGHIIGGAVCLTAGWWLLRWGRRVVAQREPWKISRWQ